MRLSDGASKTLPAPSVSPHAPADRRLSRGPVLSMGLKQNQNQIQATCILDRRAFVPSISNHLHSNNTSNIMGKEIEAAEVKNHKSGEWLRSTPA